MNLLVIEDDKATAVVIERILSPFITKSYCAESLIDAFKYLEENKADPPNVITVDLNVKDSRWEQTLMYIKRLRVKPTTVIVVVSGVQGVPDLEQRALAAGADKFIAKPFVNRGGFLANLRDAFASLTTSPDRFTNWHADILAVINEKLEKELNPTTP